MTKESDKLEDLIRRSVNEHKEFSFIEKIYNKFIGYFSVKSRPSKELFYDTALDYYLENKGLSDDYKQFGDGVEKGAKAYVKKNAVTEAVNRIVDYYNKRKKVMDSD